MPTARSPVPTHTPAPAAAQPGQEASSAPQAADPSPGVAATWAHRLRLCLPRDLPFGLDTLSSPTLRLESMRQIGQFLFVVGAVSTIATFGLLGFVTVPILLSGDLMSRWAEKKIVQI